MLLKSFVGNATVYLDRHRSRKGRFHGDWKLINNVSEEHLLSEIEVG